MRTLNKRSWIWLAMATVAMAYVSCAHTSLESACACAHPVLQFLSGAEQSAAAATSNWQSRQAKGSAERVAQSGFVLAMLPVHFIGLVSPLNVLSARSLLCLGRAPATPSLSSAFQRPPPQLA